MEVRFRRADGTEFYREVAELRSILRIAEHPFLVLRSAPIPICREDPVVTCYELYGDLEGRPIYVEQGSAHQWLR